MRETNLNTDTRLHNLDEHGYIIQNQLSLRDFQSTSGGIRPVRVIIQEDFFHQGRWTLLSAWTVSPESSMTSGAATRGWRTTRRCSSHSFWPPRTPSSLWPRKTRSWKFRSRTWRTSLRWKVSWYFEGHVAQIRQIRRVLLSSFVFCSEINFLTLWDSGCSTVVGHTPHDPEVVRSNPAGFWDFFLFFFSCSS